MQRETITFTPEGSTDVFTIKTYLTQLEKREVEKVYSMTADKLPENEKGNNLNLAIYNLMQNETIKALVVKMNEETDGEKIVNAVLNYPSNIFASFYAKIKDISDGTQKKTN